MQEELVLHICGLLINYVERNFSVFFPFLDVAGRRIVDVKDEAKPTYEYSLDH